MTKAQMETLIRNDFLALISQAITTEKETDALPVSANEIAVPCLDAEGNEAWAVIKVSIPRGTRNGEGGYTEYDAYTAADEYKFDLEEKAAKKAASEAKKAAAEKERERKREAKKVVKELNQKGLKGMIESAE